MCPFHRGGRAGGGWLRDWALAARHGITGHLDEWSPVYRDAWKGVRPAHPGDGTGWPLEQCSYWLDGSLRLGYVLHDDALIKKATDRLNLVVNGVNNGGKSFMYWKKEPPQGFNSWACSHMGRALVAWYAASGDKRILDALVRAYSEYPVPREQIKFDDISGLCNIDAMLETYAFSGDRRVLDRVLAAVKSPGVDATFRAWADRPLRSGARRMHLRKAPPAHPALSLDRRADDIGRPRIAPFSGSTTITCFPTAWLRAWKILPASGPFA